MSRPPSIESLRKRIATLQAERDELGTQKRSRAEVAVLLDSMIAQSFAAGAAILSRELQKAALGEPFTPLANSTPVLVALLGQDAIKSALKNALGEVAEGMPTKDRLERLSVIDTELDNLETQEESLCELDGIERRANARAEIILCCPSTS